MTTHITPLPTPPQPSDSVTVFDQRAFALLGGLPAFVTETNTLADELEALALAADADAEAALAHKNSAAQSATNANASAIAAGNSQTAAANSASSASTSATNANASAGRAETAASGMEQAIAMGQVVKKGEFPVFDAAFAASIGGYKAGAIVSDATDKTLLWVNGTASNTAFPAGWTSFKVANPSQTVRGMPLIASQAEVNSGVDTSKMVVPDTIKMVMGPGQSWQSPSRAIGVTYTNTTTRPILVQVAATVNNFPSETPLVFLIDSSHAFMSKQSGTSLNACTILVPPGSIYSVVAANYTLAVWREYR